MKELLLKSTKTVAIIAALFGVISLNSCKDDDTVEPGETIVEDGFYILGGASFADYDLKGTMKATRNEVKQEERAELLEAFVALKAGSEGFNIMEVAGSEKTSWGPASTFADVATGTNDEPKVTFQRGGAEKTDSKFTVPADGLYHVVLDTEVGTVAIIPVKHWGLIGAATPGGWSDDTKLESTGFDMSTITFEAKEVTMVKGDFKFRYSSGWKVEIDTAYDLGGGDKGIKVNSNFGGAVDALVPGGLNINNATGGIYTATMVWTAGEGFAATLSKTGDLPLTDYSNTELGLIGNGIYNGANQHDWNSGLMLSTPAKDGYKYTWAYNNTKVTTAGSFKIREGDNWDNLSFGYPQVTMAGDGADDFETNNDGNFVPKTNDATYNFTFEIDAESDVYTFTATKK
mgnify:CR=1 FL=1